MIQSIILPPQSLISPNTQKAENPTIGATTTDISQQFSHFLDDAINRVNDQTAEVTQLTEQFATGNLEDVHKLMIANEKSMIGLELTVQIRNKVIEAYQEIMRTQI